MIRRFTTVALVSVALVAGAGGVAQAQGLGAKKCAAITHRFPGQPAGDILAGIYRANHADYFTKTVVDRYSSRARWSVVSVIPKHC